MNSASDLQVYAHGASSIPGNRKHHVNLDRECRRAERHGLGALRKARVEEEGVLRVREYFEHAHGTAGEVTILFANVRELDGIAACEKLATKSDGLCQVIDVDHVMWGHTMKRD